MRITICDKLLSGKSTIRNITVILVTIKDYNQENYYQVSPQLLMCYLLYTFNKLQHSTSDYYAENDFGMMS